MITEEEHHAYNNLMNAIGMALTQKWTPQEELLWRVNCNVLGVDPGPSINWRGLR